MAPQGSMLEKDLTGRKPYQMPVAEVAQYFNVNVEKGYTQQQAEDAQRTHPPNELVGGEAVTWYRLLAKQIANAMTLILIMAMSLSFGVGDYTEGAVIAAVIVLNATIGFYQEFQAEKKMDALKELSSPSARLRRDGSDVVRPSAEVVPGDIVELKTGDTVPADLRLFKVMNLNCDESSLTGEAMPVEKVTMALTEERGVGDRTNIAHATTTVSKGHGWGIVVFTGMDTQVGIIASGTTKKERKEGRSLNAKKYGKKQVPKGAALRVWDYVGAFLGLTEGTPLQKALARLAYILFGGAILLAIVVFAVNGFKVSKEVAIYAISTGIAIIPESLVAVLTLTMVAGMKVMQKGNVVIRDLSALEALGGITNICSDKTGTLTQGAMIVKKAWLPNVGIFTVDSKNPNDPSEGAVKKSSEALPQDPSPASALKFDIPNQKDAKDQEKFNRSDENLDELAEMTPELDAFLKPAALCNLATVKFHTENEGGPGEWKTTGEPTEKALQVFAHRFPGYGKDDLEASGWTQCHGGEFPFDSTIKRMSVVYEHANDPNSMIFTKGAVEPIIERCSFIGSGTHTEELTEDVKKNVILEHMEYFAKQGFRVLAISQKMWDGDFAETRRRIMEAFTEEYKDLLSDNDSLTAEQKASRAKTVKEAKDKIEADLRNQVESDLTFLGLVGIYDPPRVETKASIKMCREAGIDVHMLTGDHPATATAIALDIGILPRDYSEGMVKKASDFDALNDNEIDALNELPLVIARCAPHTKTKMIQALRRRKRFMAMTGDGVNDAPSLSAADVGIAMGTGSDVAKSAAKIVLSDDKFNSIVTAISQGRRMFDNIQKFTLHLLTSNVAEVILLIAGLGFQDKAGLSVFPLSPLQILWINMLTSSAPAFGLGREKPSSTIMKRLPHDTKKGIFTNEIIVDMMVYGILMGTCTLMTFVIIIYGIHEGKESLGHDCNNVFSEACIPVFRARGAVFVELTWLILVSAWEFKSIRSSMFHLDSNQDASFINFCKNLFENKVLFFSVLLGGLSVFIPIYIQGLNTKVFKMKAIGVEWALCGGSILVFIGGVELWKLAKRRLRWFERDLAMGQGDEEEFFVKGLQRRSTGISSSSSQEKNTQVLALSTAPTTQSTEPKVQGLGTKMKA